MSICRIKSKLLKPMKSVNITYKLIDFLKQKFQQAQGGLFNTVFMASV